MGFGGWGLGKKSVVPKDLCITYHILSRPVPRIQNGLARPGNTSRLVRLLENRKNIPKQNRRLSRRQSRSPNGRLLLCERRIQINPRRHSRSIGRRRGRTGRKERVRSINPKYPTNQNPKGRTTGKKLDQNGAKEKVQSPNQVLKISRR